MVRGTKVIPSEELSRRASFQDILQWKSNQKSYRENNLSQTKKDLGLDGLNHDSSEYQLILKRQQINFIDAHQFS